MTVSTSLLQKYRKNISVSVIDYSDGQRIAKFISFHTGFQLALAKKYHLPLFLHSRAAHADFVQILQEEGFGEDGGRSHGARGGVVHSFTGSVKEAAEYQAMGFHLRSVC